MKVHGMIHQFPKEIKLTLLAFVVVLSIGYYGGLTFVNHSTSMNSSGIETQLLGNEDDEDAEIMKFKKSEREILTMIHNHILSLSVIFCFLALILSTTSINYTLKCFLMIEPFLSIVLTFGGIYVIWKGVIWFKYVVMISGVLMTICFVMSTLIIAYQILFPKKQG